MNFKEAANLEVVRYFEQNGMEAVLPPVRWTFSEGTSFVPVRECEEGACLIPF